MRRRTVTTVNGVDLTVVEAGHPSATPVVLVHGLAGSWRVWLGVLSDQRLLSRYRLIAFDLRGHGDNPAMLRRDQSSAADPGAVHQLWTHDLRAVLADLPPRHLVGWSFGSTVVQTFLRSEDEAHNTLSITLLAGPSVLGPTASDDPAGGLLAPGAFAALIDSATGGDRNYAERVLARGPDDTGASSELVASVASIAAGTLPVAVQAALSAPFDYRTYFAALSAERRMRISALVCEQDQLFDSTAMLAYWHQSGIRARLVSGEGHALPLRDPSRFSVTLLSLLA